MEIRQSFFFWLLKIGGVSLPASQPTSPFFLVSGFPYPSANTCSREGRAATTFAVRGYSLRHLMFKLMTTLESNDEIWQAVYLSTVGFGGDFV